jgi:hypothetical protein
MVGAGGADADLVNPRDRICDLVKPSATESAVKPTSADSTEEAWIYVRGCRIRSAGLRFNSQGDVYVPDSEDEEDAPEVAADGAASVDLAPAVVVDGSVGVNLAPAMATDGAAGVDMAPTVAADVAVGVDLPPTVAVDGVVDVDPAPVVAADGAADTEMKPEVATRLAKKVLGEDLHPEVATHLAKVLSEMEPCYHECFIDLYKVMVPLFFNCTP